MNISNNMTDNKTKAIYISVLCVILVSIGQTFMKFGFTQCTIPSNIEFSSDFFKAFISSFFSTPWILVGYFIAMISSVLFLEALHKAEFGITTAVLRLNYITAYFIGIIYFGETFNLINLLGLSLIFFGVLIISLSDEGNPCS